MQIRQYGSQEVNHERRIKLLRDGCDQVIQIPKEFELSGDEIILRASGDRLIFDTVKEVNLLSALRNVRAVTGSASGCRLISKIALKRRSAYCGIIFKNWSNA